jgi:pectate lyase
MTHLHGKRLPRPGREPGQGPGHGPGHRKVLATVIGLVAALGLGTIGEAQAAPADRATATAPRWSDKPHGFASLDGGTTGGAGGKVVTVTDQASLVKYAAAEEPYVIRVSGAIAVGPSARTST